MIEFTHEEKLVVIHCSDCNMAFAVTKDFQQKRIRDHRSLFCPEGHKQYYPQESDIEKANRLAREAEEKAERLRRCVDHKKDIIKHREYQVRHFKGEVTKLKKAGKGAT